jgi:hypothetical protein
MLRREQNKAEQRIQGKIVCLDAGVVRVGGIITDTRAELCRTRSMRPSDKAQGRTWVYSTDFVFQLGIFHQLKSPGIDRHHSAAID